MGKKRNEDLQERLKTIKLIMKMNTKEFAEKCDLQYNTLQNYLLGTREPTLNSIRKIVEALDINANWLLTGHGEVFASSQKGMPKAFLKRVEEDINNANRETLDTLSFNDKIKEVLSGKKILERIEVIELAKKLRQSVAEYLSLANYPKNDIDKVFKNDKIRELLNKLSKLENDEIRKISDLLFIVYKGYLAEKNVGNIK